MQNEKNNETEVSRAVWNVDPIAWTAEHSDTLKADVETVLSYRGDASVMPDVIRLLEVVRRHRAYTSSTNFLTYGTMAVPTSPIGIETLKRIRKEAKSRAKGGLAELADPGSKLALMVEALRMVSADSGIVDGWRNLTMVDGAPENQGIRVGVDLNARAMSMLPKGERLPTSIVSPTLVGREFDGNDIEEWRSGADACLSGVREFLDRFGISHDIEGGSYECGECGIETGSDDDDDGEIAHCNSFTITDDMLKALESAGYADATREYLNASGSSDSWSEFLSENTDAEILSSLVPDEKQTADGIKYDRTVWTFAPDFESIDGLDDLEFSDLARLLPILARLALSYESKGILPPIPGALVLIPPHYGTRSGSLEFQWVPETGFLSHRTSTRSAMISVDVLRESVRVSIPPAAGSIRPTTYNEDWIQLESIGGAFVARLPADAGGEPCRLWVDAAQGRIELGF